MSSLALLTASRHPDWHHRLMRGAAVALFVAAASRLFLALYERRAGRVHPAT